MSKSSDALSLLLTNWDQLKKQRPTESDFSPHGYPLTYETMDELFSRWLSVLTILDEKGYWSTSPEVAIADTPLATAINDLNNVVNGAKSYAIGWMISNRFVDISSNIQQQISSLARGQSSINKEVARLLTERGAENVDLISTAARSAEKIIDLGKVSEENVSRILQATSTIESASALAEATNSNIAALTKTVTDNAASVAGDKETIASLLKEVTELKAQALARENELVTRATTLDGQINDIHQKTELAYESVTKALRAARNQGLAASFQDRSNTLKAERRLWTITFVGSAAILLALAVVFSIDLTDMKFEALLVHLLRKVGLAAPVVWIGWYSARQVGRISRVEEDYEYKAASALAFQSYKDEAKLGGDEEMQKKLLGHAISTFGENPVRLYESHADEPVSPVQAAIKDLPAEKIANILVAFSDQNVKSRLLSLFGK